MASTVRSIHSVAREDQRSDALLVALFRDGQHAAFEVLRRRHRAAVQRHVTELLGPGPHVAAIAEQAFGQLQSALTRDERPMAFAGPWLNRRVRGLAASHVAENGFARSALTG